MFDFVRKVAFIALLIVAAVFVTSCENSLLIDATTPYTVVGSSGGGSYSVGDSLEPGGDDASEVAGIWLMTHMDGNGDDAIDLATETASPNSKIYLFATDYVYQFYSSPDGTQGSIGMGTDSNFYYSAGENIIYQISNDKVVNIFSDVVRVNEVSGGVAVSALYMKIPAGGGTYIRTEKQANDYLP